LARESARYILPKLLKLSPPPTKYPFSTPLVSRQLLGKHFPYKGTKRTGLCKKEVESSPPSDLKIQHLPVTNRRNSEPG